MLLKSHIKLITKSQVKILQWIQANQDEEVISKVYTKLKPLIDSIKETEIEEPPSIESDEEIAFIEPPIPEPEEIAAKESVSDDLPSASTASVSDDIDSAPPIPELDTEMPADDNSPEHDEAADQSISEVTDEPELPSLDSAIPEINDQTVEMQVSDDTEASQAADSSELPAISESEDAFPDIPDVPDVPDIPEEDEFIEDDSEDLPAQFRSSSDPSIEEESDQSSFDPVHGRKKIIGADLPKPESPGATWAALIMLVLPFALLFQAYSGAETQSFLSFLITYFLDFYSFNRSFMSKSFWQA